MTTAKKTKKNLLNATVHINDLNESAKKAKLTPVGMADVLLQLHTNKTVITAKDVKELLKSPLFKDTLYPSIVKNTMYARITGTKIYYLITTETKTKIELRPITKDIVQHMALITIQKISSELT